MRSFLRGEKGAAWLSLPTLQKRSRCACWRGGQAAAGGGAQAGQSVAGRSWESSPGSLAPGRHSPRLVGPLPVRGLVSAAPLPDKPHPGQHPP